MEKWVGKVAVVTGASSGIGAETSRHLVEKGMIVVGFARREDRLKALREELNGKLGKFHYLKVDLCSEKEILDAFEWVKSTMKSLDVLVNNAGVLRDSDVLGKTEDWKIMFDTNVLAPSICSRKTVEIMQELGTYGHIVNINSDSGHYPPMLTPDLYVYGATKFSSVSMTESLREFLALKKLPIRVTSISPGLVATEMVEHVTPEIPILQPSSVADAIIYALSTPKSVNIAEVIIRATGETNMPFIEGALRTNK